MYLCRLIFDQMESQKVKCLIIGSGPAGYTAAIYASRANLNPVLYEGMLPGGQLTTTTEIENFPGYPQGVDGNQMMADLRKQAERFGADLRWGVVTEVDFSERPFKVVVDGEKEIIAETVIIATGASAKYLGLPSEEKFRGQGVSACATCDGFFYRGKVVAVVGGGDTACEEATYLASLCKKVYLVVRRNVFDQLTAQITGQGSDGAQRQSDNGQSQRPHHGAQRGCSRVIQSGEDGPHKGQHILQQRCENERGNRNKQNNENRDGAVDPGITLQSSDNTEHQTQGDRDEQRDKVDQHRGRQTAHNDAPDIQAGTELNGDTEVQTGDDTFHEVEVLNGQRIVQMELILQFFLDLLGDLRVLKQAHRHQADDHEGQRHDHKQGQQHRADSLKYVFHYILLFLWKARIGLQQLERKLVL